MPPIENSSRCLPQGKPPGTRVALPILLIIPNDEIVYLYPLPPERTGSCVNFSTIYDNPMETMHTRSVQGDLEAVRPFAVCGGAVVVPIILSGHVVDFEGSCVVHHATLVQAGLVLAAGRVQWSVVLQPGNNVQQFKERKKKEKKKR